MASQDSIRDGINWAMVEARLLHGDRVKKIAEDEGLSTDAFAPKFKQRYGLSPTAWAFQQNPALENQRGFGEGGGVCHYVNEHYFDDFAENPAPDHAYVLGVLYGRPVITKKDCFEFASGNETLVDIVRNAFEWEYTPYQDATGISLLRFNGVHHLYQVLLSLGFGVKVKERLFPEIDESVLSHFMRGIVEANVSIGFFHQQHPGRMEFNRFGIPFLTNMNSHLQQYAGVQRHGSNTSQFSYTGNDSRRIRDFIYRDAEFLEDTGLYVPEIRDRWFGVGAASGSGISPSR